MSLRYCNPVHGGYFADPFVMKAPASGSRYVAIGTGAVVGDRAFEVLVSDDLVTHELTHVWQDQDHRLRMWLSYLTQGYADNPHEREARRAAAVRPGRPAARP